MKFKKKNIYEFLWLLGSNTLKNYGVESIIKYEYICLYRRWLSILHVPLSYNLLYFNCNLLYISVDELLTILIEMYIIRKNDGYRNGYITMPNDMHNGLGDSLMDETKAVFP